MRLAFMGTPDFAVPTLNALVEAGHDVVAVYSQPARPAGRGKKRVESPVARRAHALGIEVRTPEKLKGEEELEALEALALDAAVVVAYGQILTRRALAAPRLGCLNVHASLLPRWRGAAPIQRAIMAGDAETGVCIMQMEAGLDTGPVLIRDTTPIAPQDTASDLHDRLMVMGGALIGPALAGLEDASITPEPQPEEGVTYAAKIDKAEARIDWSQPAKHVMRHIHGLSPFPGAWSLLGADRVKLVRVEHVDRDGAPGTVLDDQLTIACGQGAIRIEAAQRPGKGILGRDDFLRGYPVSAGQRFK